MTQIKVGVIGCGYWGPNLVRNFSSHPKSRVVWVADPNGERLKYIHGLYPHVRTGKDCRQLLKSDPVDAVCIATPVASHYDLTKLALISGKHVLAEKPFVQKTQAARELIELAKKRKRTLMVDHTFLYSPVVRKMKLLIDKNVLGKILYLYSVRVNLGLFQKDINVVWDLAAHDIAIVNFLLGLVPESVSVIGKKLAVNHVEDVGFVFVNYPKNILFEQHLSWLDPHKIRKLTIIGDEKMAVYDDMNAAEPLKIYDRGASLKQPYYESFGQFKMLYNFGDVISPRVEPEEPLRNLCDHFLECILEDKSPLTNGQQGLEVVKVLEAAQKSVEAGGKLISLKN